MGPKPFSRAIVASVHSVLDRRPSEGQVVTLPPRRPPQHDLATGRVFTGWGSVLMIAPTARLCQARRRSN